MWLFALFLAVPLIEIALFIQVGGLIGLWPTLAIVIVTAFLGTWLMRAQGALAIGQIQSSFNDLRDPTEPLAHGAMILFAGALLLTPGFFTDAAGFLLLIPPVRSAVFRYLRSRVKVAHFSTHSARPEPQPRAAPGNTIDGEYEEITPKKQPTHTPSGWTRH
ncbi:FxsA family protein [Actibacterium ureilyticum]|uniref:FxsA family protein n=1 Tax=Actibacterium ureilyticum TaxID=1590614 RepID=UPI000BAAA88E|nr:FxsA family protein [Actibacterium ureilyticum]